MAHRMRSAADLRERAGDQRVLGEHIYLTASVAHLLGALLSSKRRFPNGVARWIAKDALSVWLPALPIGERMELLTQLKGCPERVLGKELFKVVQTEATQLPKPGNSHGSPWRKNDCADMPAHPC